MHIISWGWKSLIQSSVVCVFFKKKNQLQLPASERMDKKLLFCCFTQTAVSVHSVHSVHCTVLSAGIEWVFFCNQALLDEEEVMSAKNQQLRQEIEKLEKQVKAAEEGEQSSHSSSKIKPV